MGRERLTVHAGDRSGDLLALDVFGDSVRVECQRCGRMQYMSRYAFLRAGVVTRRKYAHGCGSMCSESQPLIGFLDRWADYRFVLQVEEAFVSADKSGIWHLQLDCDKHNPEGRTACGQAGGELACAAITIENATSREMCAACYSLVESIRTMLAFRAVKSRAGEAITTRRHSKHFALTGPTRVSARLIRTT